MRLAQRVRPPLFAVNHRKDLDCVGFGAVGQQVRCLLHRPFPRALDPPDPTDAGLAQEQIDSIKHVLRDGLCRNRALLGNVVLEPQAGRTSLSS